MFSSFSVVEVGKFSLLLSRSLYTKIMIPESVICFIFKGCEFSIAWLQRISKPTPRMVIGNSDGEGALEKPKFLRKSVKQNWKFQRGEGVRGAKTKTILGGGMVIFCNHTLLGKGNKSNFWNSIDSKATKSLYVLLLNYFFLVYSNHLSVALLGP